MAADAEPGLRAMPDVGARAKALTILDLPGEVQREIFDHVGSHTSGMTLPYRFPTDTLDPVLPVRPNMPLPDLPHFSGARCLTAISAL